MIEAPRFDVPWAAATSKLLCEVRRLAPLARNLHGRQELTLLDQAGHACGRASPKATRFIEQAFIGAGAGGIKVIGNAAAAPTSFGQLLSQRVSAALSYRYDQWPTDGDMDQAVWMLQTFDFEPPPPRGKHQLLVMTDGVQVSTYTSIAAGKPPVLMVLPCGMPFGLCQDWFDVLSQDYSVLACESRGLFGVSAHVDSVSLDLNSQLADLFGLLDHHGVSSAHVMGLCGGAVLAMRAVQRQPGRFHSMSLWYGDYHVADQKLRTQHQKNFDWLMAEAGEDRAQARELQKMFTDPAILSTVPDRIAHWVLYPYANPESMYRYSRLNACLNNEDVTASLPALTLPTLVVAGDSDSTTHSGASAFVAAGMPQARFELERNGNHQEFFSVPQRSRELALRFLSGRVSA
jgi:3-oxoadipate enol-lactonase